jgi:hypothetical protein
MQFPARAADNMGKQRVVAWGVVVTVLLLGGRAARVITAVIACTAHRLLHGNYEMHHAADKAT